MQPVVKQVWKRDFCVKIFNDGCDFEKRLFECSDQNWFWEFGMRLTESVHYYGTSSFWQRICQHVQVGEHAPSCLRIGSSAGELKMKADSCQQNFHQQKLEKQIKPQISAPKQ